MLKLTLLLSLLWPVIASSQCEYTTDKIDEFTKMRSVSTEQARVGVFTMGEPQLYMALSRFEKDGEVAYYIYASLDEIKQHTCLSTGSKLYILDYRGEVVELDYNGEVDCGDMTFAGNYRVSGYFPTTPDQLKLLKGRNIDKVRMVTADGIYSIKMRTNNKGFGVKYFERAVPCVLD